MAEFKALRVAEELPQRGAGETNVLDFKGKLDRDDAGGIDYCELAKDVAAFANADGGTLLYRAFEDTGRAILGTYGPLTIEESKVAREAYSKAIAEYCWPKPIASVEEAIPLDGGFVVAVNVWPYTSGLVGVRTRQHKDAYFFPLRASLQTVFLHVEQLPMFLSPEVRRKAILLRRVPADARVKLRLRFASGLVQGNELLWVEGVSESENSVTFSSKLGGSDQDKQVFPLERVHAVYKEASSWVVIVDGWS